ncbi:hypothetical protein [Microcoleus sp. LAD1_D3]|uniref:hypothetical protein n=1 Tax=Microcoleus sp. LAD1_D3 TaxID=2819365 RepID=UPI002FCF42C6
MPPEQFGGRAVPASDLYGLGATLIALITKQHPADLPQQDLQLEFEQFTKLSPGFTNWLKWMTHPSLERRPALVQIAKEVLEKPQTINKYSLPLKQGKTVNTFSLFWNAIGRSIGTGSLAVGACAAIYSTFFFSALMTIIVQGILGIFLGLLLGLGNGIIVAIVTRLCFFPLTNPKLHRQVLNGISIVLCTLVSLDFLPKTSLPYYSSSSYYILVLAPSLIAGLSMGESSKYFARWYQRKSGL